MKKHIIEGVLLSLLTIFVPTIATLMISGQGVKVSIENEEQKVIEMEYEDGSVELGVEEFLIFVLAKEYNGEESEEYMKMRAVMERTLIYKAFGEKESLSSKLIDTEYLTEKEIKEKYGSSYEEKIAYIKNVISDTKNEKIYFANKLIDPLYHNLSAGITRDGTNINGSLISVVCDNDKQVEGYEEAVTFTKEDLKSKLGSDAITILNRCEADYVVKVRVGDEVISGEAFKEMLGLKSSSFIIKENEENVEITTKGIGHGYGVSLNTAKVFANEGKEYKEILEYFYKNIEVK